MRRQTIIAFGAALCLTAPLVAQDPPTAARRPAPTALSDSQRAQLRAIHDKYRPEFTKQHEEMTALRQKMQAEVEQALPAELRERFAAQGERGMGRHGMEMRGMGMRGMPMRGMMRMHGRGMPAMGGHPGMPGMGGMKMPAMGVDSVPAKRPTKAAAPAPAAKPAPH